MTTRFTDDMFHNTEGSDFIVRNRLPFVIQIFLVFSIAFVAIYLAAVIMKDLDDKTTFFLTLAVIICSLGAFTVFFAARLRDLVLATEFQNAMLASAAQLSTRFCLITKRDGAIVYIDPGFQTVFPHFRNSDGRSIDGLLTHADISQELIQKILGFLEKGQSDRLLLPFRDASNNAMSMMVSIDALPRPKGYFLFRGRDYIEKRTTEIAGADTASALLLAQALYALPEGVLVADSSGTITYVNHALEEWLGFAPGEILASPCKLSQIFYQYAGSGVGQPTAENFSGEVTLQRKNRSLVPMAVNQASLYQDGKFLGISAIVSIQDGVKKN